MNEAAVRVLVVYGYEPSGHAAAAFALEDAGRRAGLLVSRVEVAGVHHPLAASAIARGYHGLLGLCPSVWGALYRSESVRQVLRSVRRGYLNFGGAKKLRAGILREGADLIVCPQACIAAVLAEARRRAELQIPVVSVLTDYAEHPFWADPPADLVIAPSEGVARDLVRCGVPAERVRVLGLPIHSAFLRPPSRAEARQALAIPSAAPVVLVSGGSKGLGAMDRTVSALLRGCPRAIVIALCGSNDRLRSGLCVCREVGGRLRIFGPQPPAMMATFLAACDLHCGKPGGVTTAESLAIGVPMVLAQPLPGQEESNARHLVAVGAAVSAGSPEETARLCAGLLLNHPRRARFAANAARAGRPRAAQQIISEIRRFALRLTPSSQAV